ncbi:11508_t:CDS:2, partial [Scutellospora calospora]
RLAIHNYMSGINVTQNVITHFDVSNNAIVELDLSKSGNLQILNCSTNPLTKLVLPDFFDPISFDCSNTHLNKVETNSFIFDCQTGTKFTKGTTTLLASSTTSLNNGTIVGIVLVVEIADAVGILFLTIDGRLISSFIFTEASIILSIIDLISTAFFRNPSAICGANKKFCQINLVLLVMKQLHDHVSLGFLKWESF